MGNEQFDFLLSFFKTLADASRLKILGILASGEYSVSELAAILNLRDPTVSHHLARLSELGLVEMRPEGNNRLYSLNQDALEAMSKEIFASPEQISALADDVEWDAWEQKVLRDYFEGDQLKQIPTKFKKLQVVLRWLAGQFEPGVRYSERQVNEIIERHHPDFATLRRELIDTRLMQRESGIYWLVEQ